MTKLITPRQAHIYRIWASLNGLDVYPVTSRHKNKKKSSKALSEHLKCSGENIRKTITNVISLLEQGETLPPEGKHCPKCQGFNIQQLPDTKAGNQQFYCCDCEKTFVWRK